MDENKHIMDMTATEIVEAVRWLRKEALKQPIYMVVYAAIRHTGNDSCFSIIAKGEALEGKTIKQTLNYIQATEARERQARIDKLKSEIAESLKQERACRVKIDKATKELKRLSELEAKS